MKKTTPKAAKTPAPAPKVAPKLVKKAAVTPVKKTAAPAVKTAPSKTVATVIGAKIDIGFGNLLYIRGEGPGLSWDIGVPLECVQDDLWSITLPETSKAIVYKLLINDLVWSAGPDYQAEPGKKTSIIPTF